MKDLTWCISIALIVLCVCFQAKMEANRPRPDVTTDDIREIAEQEARRAVENHVALYHIESDKRRRSDEPSTDPADYEHHRPDGMPNL